MWPKLLADPGTALQRQPCARNRPTQMLAERTLISGAATVQLGGRKLSRGAWYAPRLGLFSVAVDTFGQKIALSDVSLIGPDGTQLLLNCDFSAGMAHWFPISERVHLPWHIKSLPLNLLFEQGMLGLILFTLLAAAALWRLTRGRASLD